ncbi:MAG: Tetratricopeptide repeat-containing protein [Candidatus Electronema aureum]|uniref:Tetratricopeptide repeat-containing protein n=1 Tax=Candidatus Electronema aureum TaxID=2005002 RepID=A0A521G5M0_9BACT|nr:MAG: Tetratricopeptide repeat-containing protein [Candidatus Electronema aureum]
MQKLLFALFLLAMSAGSAAAHGDISKLPDSVQIMQYKMLLYMDANDAETKNNLAMAYVRTKQLDLAVQELEGVLKKDTSNFDALDGMGIILLKQKKADEALKYLERALAINDKDAMLHVHFSLVHEQLKQAEQATAALKKAGELAPGPEGAAAVQNEIKLISQS